MAKVLIKLWEVESLKEKRSIVRTLINLLEKQFRVSALETELLDSKEYISIGISFVAIKESDAENKLDKIEEFLDQRYTVEAFEYDILNF